MATWFLMWTNKGSDVIQVGEYSGQSFDEMKRKAEELSKNGIGVTLAKGMGYVNPGYDFHSILKKRGR